MTGHGLAAPEPEDIDSRATTLARLEEELPTGFPALARDQGFVHLIEEWMRLPQVDELVRQLQEGGVAPVIAAPDEEDGRGGGGAGCAGFSDLQGWRERQLFDGPVVFFAGRVTPARQQRCRELGARITAGCATLMQYIDAAVADIRQHRA
ncbi:hypothetical protein [Streptomyces sp. NPDC050164]|uniref:hypothetical protein n=1 Tax=Streptomyces sp. NPDC050164 TaxID=3365605 RepID=UPI00379BECE5